MLTKLSGVIVVATLGLCPTFLRAGDATQPVDYTVRNEAFATGATVTPEKKDLPQADAIQDRRVDKTVVDKKPVAVGERRAPIAVQETSPKNIREKESSPPKKVDEPMHAFDHREAPITTTDTKKPPVVTKYQNSLSAASSTNMARFPAIGANTTAKINRFVFRKNSPDPTPVTGDAAVTPAAGGSPVQK
jgi:hypothetical protein